MRVCLVCFVRYCQTGCRRILLSSYTRLLGLSLSDSAKQAAGVYGFPAITGGSMCLHVFFACRMTTRFIMFVL